MPKAKPKASLRLRKELQSAQLTERELNMLKNLAGKALRKPRIAAKAAGAARKRGSRPKK